MARLVAFVAALAFAPGVAIDSARKALRCPPRGLGGGAGSEAEACLAASLVGMKPMGRDLPPPSSAVRGLGDDEKDPAASETLAASRAPEPEGAREASGSFRAPLELASPGEANTPLMAAAVAQGPTSGLSLIPRDVVVRGLLDVAEFRVANLPECCKKGLGTQIRKLMRALDEGRVDGPTAVTDLVDTLRRCKGRVYGPLRVVIQMMTPSTRGVFGSLRNVAERIERWSDHLTLKLVSQVFTRLSQIIVRGCTASKELDRYLGIEAAALLMDRFASLAERAVEHETYARAKAKAIEEAVPEVPKYLAGAIIEQMDGLRPDQVIPIIRQAVADATTLIEAVHGTLAGSWPRLLWSQAPAFLRACLALKQCLPEVTVEDIGAAIDLGAPIDRVTARFFEGIKATTFHEDMVEHVMVACHDFMGLLRDVIPEFAKRFPDEGKHAAASLFGALVNMISAARPNDRRAEQCARALVSESSLIDAPENRTSLDQYLAEVERKRQERRRVRQLLNGVGPGDRWGRG